MKDEDNMSTRISLSVCPCPLHIKFDKFFLGINQLIFLYREWRAASINALKGI